MNNNVKAAVIKPGGTPFATVLTSRDHPVNKKYSLDAAGRVQITPYQNAARFNTAVHPIAGIVDLARLIDQISHGSRQIIIRGLHPLRKAVNVARNKVNFPEHPDGTPWAMLDFDDVVLPADLDPLSVEAIQWVVAKLPAEFQIATYFYQFSSSAGISGSDGTPKKKGLNVHLFFWFLRRIPGEVLAGYLRLHCLQTGFYWFKENKGGVVDLKLGIDPAPIRTSVQPHYVARPEIGPGVRCLLTPEKRQGLVRKSKLSVALPAFPANIVSNANQLQRRVRNDWMREHGYRKRTLITRTPNGVTANAYHQAPNQGMGGGRAFVDGKLSGDGDYLILYFDDESTPGSWYVAKVRPQIAHRYGDGASLALRELSEGAYAYVRDTLRWFVEIPVRELFANKQGYRPAIANFAKARVSLVLAPTGSGQSRQVIGWIRPLCKKGLVIYSAPTISLVNQMQAELDAAKLAPHRYNEVGPCDFPNVGIVVTTNGSLPRILKIAHQAGLRHELVLDEIHSGLDNLLRSSKRKDLLEQAIANANRTLLLTGTLTPLQRLKLIDIALHAVGASEDFCIYNFQRVKVADLDYQRCSR